MTANEIITAALQAIGVLQETESPSAEQSATALVRLNDMMAGLQGDGIDLGYAPQSDPTVDVGINIESRQAIKSMLAVILCQDYERQPSVVTASLAEGGLNKLLRDSLINNPVPTPQTLPRGDSSGGGYVDITTG